MTSTLRPELGEGGSQILVPDDTAYFLIRDSVERRRSLFYGALDGPQGAHCALGAFWADNPRLTVSWDIVNEVAAVNDSVKPGPNASKLRWQKVRSWLRWKVRLMALKSNA